MTTLRSAPRRNRLAGVPGCRGDFRPSHPDGTAHPEGVDGPWGWRHRSTVYEGWTASRKIRGRAGRAPLPTASGYTPMAGAPPGRLQNLGDVSQHRPSNAPSPENTIPPEKPKVSEHIRLRSPQVRAGVTARVGIEDKDRHGTSRRFPW